MRKDTLAMLRQQYPVGLRVELVKIHDNPERLEVSE